MKSIRLGQTSRQAGNVLFVVLIAVALFAALTFSFTRTNKSAGKISAEDAQLHAQEIMSFSGKVNNAVQRVSFVNDCLASQVSFENTTVAGYTNAGSPANKKCNIFDNAGGVVAYEAPPSGALDTAAAATASGGGMATGGLVGQYFFTGKVCIDGVGTGAVATCSADALDNEELLLIMPWVSAEVCIAINRILGNSAAMLVDTSTSFDATKFTGTFVDGFALGNPGGGYTTYPVGCYQSPAGGTPGAGYHFYQVLLTR